MQKPVLLVASLILFGVVVISLEVTAHILLGSPTGVYLSGEQLRASGYEHEQWLWLLYTGRGLELFGALGMLYLVTRINRGEELLRRANEAMGRSQDSDRLRSTDSELA